MTDKTPGAEYKEHGRWGGGGSLYEACLYGDGSAAQNTARTPALVSEEEAAVAAVAAIEADAGMGARAKARAALAREKVSGACKDTR